MEGGDHYEEVPEAVVQPEITEKEPDIVEEIPDKSSEALTDSILDDDLVVIPSLNELQQESAPSEEPADTVISSEPSPAAEPEPHAVTPASEPSQPVAPPQPIIEPPQPVVEPPQPVVEPPQPVVEPPQPVVEPPQPVVEPPQPVVEPPQPVVEPPQPVIEPVQSQPISPPQANQEPSPRARPSINTRPASATVRTLKPTRAIENDDDDDFEDETLTERLVGLTEMFPETLCTVAGVTFSLSVSGVKKLFNFSRSALWIGSTSFMILILPVVFETEMVHMEQAQIQRQKQILLGPNAATAGGMTGGLTPPMPGVSIAAPPLEAR